MALDAAVVFVSAGMFEPKKRDHALARRQLYLNYGALSLATQLELAGHCAILVHGEHRSPAEILNQLVTSRYLPSRYPLMLSIPSFYALPWAQDFARLFKRIFPGDEIIVGGRWVVRPDVDWFRDKIPEAGRLVPGLGEGVLCDLLASSQHIHERRPASTPDFPLNHRLVLGYEAFQPSIEVSRGCGMGCVFCEERDIRLERVRDATRVAQFLELTSAQYNRETIHPYLQASFFAPGRNWANQLATEVKNRGLT